MRARTSAALLMATALIALLTTAGCTTNVTSTTGPAPDTVTVVGSGSGSAAPDRVTLSMSVNAHARSATDAMNSATTAMDQLTAAMKAVGLTDAEMQTQQISVYQQGGAGSSSYQANQALTVKTTQIGKLGKILAEATRTGASDISGPSFSLADTDRVQALAISRAMRDAKTRAMAMAKAAGRGLGGVVSINETVQPSSYASRESVYDVAGSGNGIQGTMKAAIAPTISPGRISVSAQMSVVYALQ